MLAIIEAPTVLPPKSAAGAQRRQRPLVCDARAGRQGDDHLKLAICSRLKQGWNVDFIDMDTDTYIIYIHTYIHIWIWMWI